MDEWKQQIYENFENFTLAEQRDILKQYIYIINAETDELKILKSCLIQYYEAYNNKMHSVSEFVFGTEIMRLLYLFNRPNEAIEVCKFGLISL